VKETNACTLGRGTYKKRGNKDKAPKGRDHRPYRQQAAEKIRHAVRETNSQWGTRELQTAIERQTFKAKRPRRSMGPKPSKRGGLGGGVGPKVAVFQKEDTVPRKIGPWGEGGVISNIDQDSVMKEKRE